MNQKKKRNKQKGKKKKQKKLCRSSRTTRLCIWETSCRRMRQVGAPEKGTSYMHIVTLSHTRTYASACMDGWADFPPVARVWRYACLHGSLAILETTCIHACIRLLADSPDDCSIDQYKTIHLFLFLTEMFARSKTWTTVKTWTFLWNYEQF